MKLSTERILTTHTGSLPRPPALKEALERLDRGELPDAERQAMPELVAGAVKEIVADQVNAGVDAVNDGEAGKVGYATYVTERMTGFGGEGAMPSIAELADFPEWAAASGLTDISTVIAMPACTSDVSYKDTSAVEADIANLKAALAETPAHDAFLSAASPGVVSLFLSNQHYPSHEAYLQALADALKTEYDAIHKAGIVLQIDCPDLAMGRHIQFPGQSLNEWQDTVRKHVEALNHATRDIPPQDMRMHLCWGNYEGPHNHDVPLADVLEIVFSARPAAISFEAANPRHEHEWRVFEDVDLPDGKVLIPGVVDSTTNYIEHPELVAQRLVNFAKLVGRENVLAGSDCGFATFASLVPIDPKVTYAKLSAMAEGARIASRELWGAGDQAPLTA